MERTQLCKGLLDLKHHLGDLEVIQMLKSMQKWDCLTELQADTLRKTPKAQQLEIMLGLMNNGSYAQWSLLVCVFLELGRGDLAQHTWTAVQTQLKTLKINKRSQEAMDLWDEFVRRMLSALVLDQCEHREQTAFAESPCCPVLSLPDTSRQKEASKIWDSIVNEAARDKSENLRVWATLTSGVAGVVAGRELESIQIVCKGLIDVVIDRLKNGDGKERCESLLRLLMEVVENVFSDEELEQIHVLAKEAMLKIQGSNQRFFVDSVSEIMLKHLELLLDSDRQELATKLHMVLLQSTSDLMDEGATELVRNLWRALCDKTKRIPERLDSLYKQIEKMKTDGKVPRTYLEEMRASIPSSYESTAIATDALLSRTSKPTADCYFFRPGKHNRALVINNMDFREDERRDGSDMDELAVTSLLKGLGFHVKQIANLSTDRLLEEIAAFARRPDHEDGDVAALAVMSHGANEALVGTDSKELSFQSVIDCFSNAGAPKLAGKPKWLSFHACRTHSREANLKPAEPVTLAPYDNSYDNLFMTYTACPGKAAFRNRVQGTWYVQALKQVLDTSAPGLSLFEIHLEVQKVMNDMWQALVEHTLETPSSEASGLVSKVTPEDQTNKPAPGHKETDEPTSEFDEKSKPTLEVRTHRWTKKLCFKSSGDRI